MSVLKLFLLCSKKIQVHKSFTILIYNRIIAEKTTVSDVDFGISAVRTVPDQTTGVTESDCMWLFYINKHPDYIVSVLDCIVTI